MRRRLTVTITAVVVGALALAGLGTLLLTYRATADETQLDLEDQAVAIAQAAESAERPATVQLLRRALRLEGATLARRSPRGWVDLPAGVDADDLDPLTGRPSVRGQHGRLAYAAARIDTRRGPQAAVVLTRRVPGLVTGLGWFAVAATAALVIAVLSAARLGRRISRPLEQAEVATRRIAAGDLSARVPLSEGTDAELASLIRSINAMAASLERSRAVERQFLLSVSHDLRTPLTSIRGFAEAIADGATEDTERAAGVISAESRRLERLVGDLLDLAHLDADRFSLELSTVDVVDVVRDTADGFRPAAEAAGLELRVRTAATDAPAAADGDRLAQCVANLVENAMKFALARIDVAVEHEDGRVVIAVSDDGPGIPVDEHSRVFERLYQSDRKPVRPGGSGLGLAIVAELVRAMGGTVEARDAPGGGARLVISLRAASS